jgi:hypothetical protein
VSVFLKKNWEKFEFGTEVATISYNKEPDVIGIVARAKYKPGAFFIDTEFAMSTQNQQNYFVFNSNYRPLLILYRQNVGPLMSPRQIRTGGPFGAAIGDGNGNGAYLYSLGMGYGFNENRHVLDTKVAYVQLFNEGSNGSKNLGVEWDTSFLHTWYDNFKTSYQFGVVFPGEGFGSTNRIGWGLQLRGYLVF